ncbi:hypothetical protein HH308_06560 [Gordonia sp. TBRC 11910]|uniref:NCS1 family nucleobase:cation symporter-1 n=1 Tax=Gordonia asplenii TaxID=2725283 RepID=A0A848KPA5_9ACTN|nr:cytosine permease [Gordonia asplenii]NMO00874.1 hypothetical protein [Gordonia asplenii]
MARQSATQQIVTERALTARLPVLHNERIYTSYSTFMWTCTAFGAATWAYIIGSALPYVGNTKVGVLAFFAGQVVGMVAVALSSGMPSVRYGVDTIDAVKTSFGSRGMVIPLVGLILTLVGWTCVLVALTAQGVGNVATNIQHTESASKLLLIIVGVAAVLATWVIVVRGPWLFERISNYIAPGHLVLAGVMIVILLLKFPFSDLFNANIPAADAYTSDRLKAVMLAFEFGLSGAFTWWPAMGGLTRLVQRQNHVVGPSVVGCGIFGAAFLSAIAAVAAVKAGTYDPTVWMVTLGGNVFGTLMVAFLIAANIPTMVIMIYLAGIAIQQIRVFTRLPWAVVVAILLVPPMISSFYSDWVMANVVKWLTYNGLMFAGITGITLVDYFVLRRQQVDARSLFVRGPGGKYWFWGGFNLVAVAVTALSVGLYLWLFDPITLDARAQFRYVGVSIPTVVLSALVYYTAMRIIAIPLRKGSYERYTRSSNNGATAVVPTVEL